VSTLVSHLARDLPSLRASADPADQVAYARDLWPRHHLAVRAGNVAEHRPGAVVWPESTADVQSLVRWAAAAGIPLVPFGAGSGVCAAVLPHQDVVVVDLKRMARWRNLDPRAPSLNVEAGHMGMPLEEELVRRGFTLGHFPSSILCSTVGGWVAARSAGQNSGYYGKMEDMVAALECVTGEGEAVTLNRRTHGPDLLPLIIGSEGTLAVITAATLRLHSAPKVRGFTAWSLPSTEVGWEAMRTLFQAGLRPAVCRLYDPFDAMIARKGAVHSKEKGKPKAPGLGATALRTLLRRPGFFNALIDSSLGTRALGGALLLCVFEGDGERPLYDVEQANRLVESTRALRSEHLGEGPARRWLEHRYSISYRQAPTIASGLFLDTMEVAAPWSKLGDLYHGVRRALGESVFVMAHLSHAYPDGCCIYFSFAGSASPSAKRGEWDAACERVYDATWDRAIKAAIEAGGTLAHHHGVGRSKAPRLREELGSGIDVFRALKRVFDPKGILNPGNLLPPISPSPWVDDAHPKELAS
jgi:alkyldihydroxyacetonephosphate synthase